MKSYQHIFFDWDGCLAKTLEVWFDAINASLTESNVPHSDRDVCVLMNTLYTGAIGLGIKPEDYPSFKEKVYSRASVALVDVRLYDGAESLLKNLRSKGKKLALISSGSKPILERMLERTGAKEYFDFVISGSDVEKRKPHPEGIEKALARLKSEKASTIMVGDSEHDLAAARSAGIDSVLFYPDHHTTFYDLESLKKANPTYTIRAFEELEQLLE